MTRVTKIVVFKKRICVIGKKVIAIFKVKSNFKLMLLFYKKAKSDTKYFDVVADEMGDFWVSVSKGEIFRLG